MTSDDRVIIGIDPGYDRVGWAVSSRNALKEKKIIDCGCIQTSSKDDIFTRYKQILDQLGQIIKRHHPAEAAIESLFFFKNKTTALRVSEARGVIISTLLHSGTQITEYTPLQVKQYVTGYGTADKKSVEKMIKLQLSLPDQYGIDDMMDACALVLTHKLADAVQSLTRKNSL